MSLSLSGEWRYSSEVKEERSWGYSGVYQVQTSSQPRECCLFTSYTLHWDWWSCAVCSALVHGSYDRIDDIGSCNAMFVWFQVAARKLKPQVEHPPCLHERILKEIKSERKLRPVSPDMIRRSRFGETLKVPWNQNESFVGVSIHMLVLRLSVRQCAPKFTFRRYKHSKLAVRHFRQNVSTHLCLTSSRTSATNQTFRPIKCSLESEAPAPYTINRRGWNRSLVHLYGEGHVMHYIGDRERFRQCKYAFHWGKIEVWFRTNDCTERITCTSRRRSQNVSDLFEFYTECYIL